MIKKTIYLISLLTLLLPHVWGTLPPFTKDTQLTFIDTVTIISESKLLYITRLASLKLFEINGNIYDYDLLFNGQQKEVYWVDATKQKFPRGFLFDLNEDNAPLIKPIGYSKNVLPY